MKIKYDLSDDYKRYYDIANGILVNYKKLNKKKPVIHTFRHTIIISFFIYEFLAMLCLFISMLLSIKISLIISIMVIILALVYFIFSFIIFYKYLKSPLNSKVGELEINKTGIIDKSSSVGTKEFKYSEMDKIAITKDIIVFILKDRKAMVMVNAKNVKKFIKYIKENSSLEIVEL